MIIPTHNRPEALRDALTAIASRSPADDPTEILVVDDGSTESYSSIQTTDWPFTVRWLREERGGATVARNGGAKEAGGAVLVFMDDDIVPEPQTIHLLVQYVLDKEKTVALGTLITKPPAPVTLYAYRLMADERNALAAERSRAMGATLEVPRTRCLTGLLAIRRGDFEALGGFQDPTGGWPNWDDVDFGVRAGQAGFRLVRLTDALAEHRDRVVADLESAAERYRRASRSAVHLFTRYPDLRAELPMFHDMTPIEWRQDPPPLIVRKLLRRLSAIAPSRLALAGLTSGLERIAPTSSLLEAAYRWTVGAAICFGYHEGLQAERSGRAA